MNTDIGLLGLWLVITLIMPMEILSQNKENSHELLSVIDSTRKIYGLSDILVNGAVYFQENPKASGSPFLFSPDYTKGAVFIGGHCFDNCDLNYDIVSKQLILLSTMPTGARLPICLDNMLVDSFLLYDYLFINTNKLHVDLNTTYVLALSHGNNQLVLAYSKQFIHQYNQNIPFGKFSHDTRTLYYLTNHKAVRIKSKKYFQKLFPNIKKELTQYISKKHLKIKKASPEQLHRLMEFCHFQMNLQND
ncbi:MAG: hypothetical protein Q8O72_16620 [Bacteroidales bacterium]|nr:hypothetical protein [Bacteroidales bacterium]